MLWFFLTGYTNVVTLRKYHTYLILTKACITGLVYQTLWNSYGGHWLFTEPTTASEAQ